MVPTYKSEAHGSVSCIYHIIGPRYLLSRILSCSVFSDGTSLNTSDHHPVIAVMIVHLYPVSWDKMSHQLIHSGYTDVIHGKHLERPFEQQKAQKT